MQNCSRLPALCVKLNENEWLCDVDSETELEKSEVKVSGKSQLG